LFFCSALNSLYIQALAIWPDLLSWLETLISHSGWWRFLAGGRATARGALKIVISSAFDFSVLVLVVFLSPLYLHPFLADVYSEQFEKSKLHVLRFLMIFN